MKEKKPKVKKPIKSSKKTTKTGTRKSTEKPEKKPKIKSKKEEKLKKVAKPKTKKPAAKKPVKKAQVKEKAEKKTPAKKAPAKKTKLAEKTIKGFSREMSIPKQKKIGVPARTIGIIKEQATVPQRVLEEIKKAPAAFPQGLPAEYGDNRITIMIVDPWKLFAYWEVRNDTLSKIKGKVVLRVYDMTGIVFDVKSASIIFDIPVYERIGSGYIGVGPSKDFIVDIGVTSKEGKFISIARSNRVTTPQSDKESHQQTVKASKSQADDAIKEGVFTQEPPESIPAVGYF